MKDLPPKSRPRRKTSALHSDATNLSDPSTMSVEAFLAALEATDPEPGEANLGICIAEDLGDPESTDGRALAKRFSTVLNRHLPILPVEANMADLSNALHGRFPWATAAIATILGEIACKRAYGDPQKSGCLRPLLFVGPTGCGKTSLASYAADLLGLPSRVIPCGGAADSGGLLPVARGWTSAKPCGPFEAIHAHGIANPLLILDELDKTSTEMDHKNGNLQGSLLTMMNRNGRYFDSCLQTNVDLSHVTFWATANSLAPLTGPLLDRFDVIEVQAPGPKHFETVLANIIADERERLGAGPEALPAVPPATYLALSKFLSGKGGSIRAVQKAYRSWLSDLALKTLVPPREAMPGPRADTVIRLHR